MTLMEIGPAHHNILRDLSDAVAPFVKVERGGPFFENLEKVSHTEIRTLERLLEYFVNGEFRLSNIHPDPVSRQRGIYYQMVKEASKVVKVALAEVFGPQCDEAEVKKVIAGVICMKWITPHFNDLKKEFFLLVEDRKKGMRTVMFINLPFDNFNFECERMFEKLYEKVLPSNHAISHVERFLRQVKKDADEILEKMAEEGRQAVVRQGP